MSGNSRGQGVTPRPWVRSARLFHVRDGPFVVTHCALTNALRGYVLTHRQFEGGTHPKGASKPSPARSVFGCTLILADPLVHGECHYLESGSNQETVQRTNERDGVGLFAPLGRHELHRIVPWGCQRVREYPREVLVTLLCATMNDAPCRGRATDGRSANATKYRLRLARNCHDSVVAK